MLDSLSVRLALKSFFGLSHCCKAAQSVGNDLLGNAVMAQLRLVNLFGEVFLKERTSLSIIDVFRLGTFATVCTYVLNGCVIASCVLVLSLDK